VSASANVRAQIRLPCKSQRRHRVVLLMQGSRNIRNSVHALFKAFDDMQLRLANV